MQNAPPEFPRSHLGPGSAKYNSGQSWEQRSFPQDLSDGLESKWPPQPPYRGSDERNYLMRLAQDWAERDGTAKPGVGYYLESLPAGYGCFEVDQISGSQRYKRLFGHPSGRFYDSIVKFEVHFFWLLDERPGKCSCILCGNVKHVPGPAKPRNKTAQVEKILPKSAPKLSASLRQLGPPLPRHRTETSGEDGHSSRSESLAGVNRERGRRTAGQPLLSYPVDEEGTKNEFKMAIIQAHNQQDSAKDIDYDIVEWDSIDYFAEKELLTSHFTQIELQHSFIPRRGELVLWCPDFQDKHYLLRDMSRGVYQFYDFKEKRFVGFPRWRAGIVTATPSATSKNGVSDFPDILDNPQKKTSLNTAGFRIETMPDPNNDKDKSLSKQYKYVPLRNIRPLSHWQLVLNGIPQKDLHRSITYALTCMTSLSLVQKTRFIGHWDRGGFVNVKACYLGSELITIGDAVRLTPSDQDCPCTDIMVVDSIRLKMAGFKHEHLDSQNPLSCSSLQVHFVGQAYTIDIKRADGYPTPEQIMSAGEIYMPHAVHFEDVKRTFRPVGTGQYGEWFPVHSRQRKMDVSYDQILGRLYEADAVRLWSGQQQQKSGSKSTVKPDLSFDTASIIAGRKYATKADERIPDLPADDPDGIRWLLSDSRAQALAVSSVNGVEVAAYHEIRTPATLAEWRIHVKIHTGQPHTVEVPKEVHAQRSRPKYYFGGDLTEEKRPGRKTGSKVIDGKVYTADMLVNITETPKSSRAPKRALEAQNQDVDEEVEDYMDQSGPEIDDSQPAFKHSSQMAGAALNNTDEEDVLGTYDEDNDEDVDDQTYPEQHRSLKSRLAAYGDLDEEEDELNEDMQDFYVSEWELNNRKATKDKSKVPPSKSQIMQSVEEGHDSALYAVDAYDGSEEEADDLIDEDSLKDWDIEKWKQVQSARGGTEESEGGDYEPGDTQ